MGDSGGNCFYQRPLEKHGWYTKWCWQLIISFLSNQVKVTIETYETFRLWYTHIRSPFCDMCIHNNCSTPLQRKVDVTLSVNYVLNINILLIKYSISYQLIYTPSFTFSNSIEPFSNVILANLQVHNLIYWIALSDCKYIIICMYVYNKILSKFRIGMQVLIEIMLHDILTHSIFYYEHEEHALDAFIAIL